MLDAGWLSHETPTGLAFGAPEEQLSAFKESDADCAASSGIDINPSSEPLTEDQMRLGYASMLAMQQCLIAAGFDFSEAPSVQSYIESDALWSPFDDIASGDFFDAEEACPQRSFF